MMILIGDSNIHMVDNVTGRVLGAIDIEDRNGIS